MQKVLLGFILSIFFTILSPLQAQDSEPEKGRIGFGSGMIASIAAEDDWGINSRFLWGITPNSTIEVEANRYFDRKDLRSMNEFSLNYQREVWEYKRFYIYLLIGYLGNNYGWDPDDCRNCWAIRHKAWNHAFNGGLGLSAFVGGRSYLFLEFRAKSIGNRYTIAVFGLNYYLFTEGED